MNKANDIINLNEQSYGVITSNSYPNWEAKVNYNLQFTSSDSSKAIQFYVIDLDIEDEDFSESKCKNSYIKFDDDVSRYTLNI